jgi:hypothetical protein
MDLEPEVKAIASPEPLEFAEPLPPPELALADPPQELDLADPPLALVQDAAVLEGAPPIDAFAAWAELEASDTADIDVIDVDEITDSDRRPARLQVGLAFVGIGALSLTMLILYINTFHPEFDTTTRLQEYWYQYVFSLCLGVAGLFTLGRETMRGGSNRE